MIFDPSAPSGSDNDLSTPHGDFGGPGVGFGGGFGQYDAFCLETQHYPNSPNERSFPSTVLKPGQRYQQTTVFQFGTVKSGE